MATDVQQIKELLDVHLGYINTRFDKVEKKIEDLSATGCERGRANGRAIIELQNANKGLAQRAGAAAGGLVSVIGGVALIIIEYFRSRGQ